MATVRGKKFVFKQNRIPGPSKTVFRYSGEIVRVLKQIPGQDLVYLFVFRTNTTVIASLTEFNKTKRRCWGAYNTMLLIGRQKRSWEIYIQRGLIPAPTYASPGCVKGPFAAYYDEDEIFKIRDAIAEIPRGSARKDGKMRSRTKVLTKSELRSKIGDGRLLYVQNDEGQFVPIWSETA